MSDRFCPNARGATPSRVRDARQASVPGAPGGRFLSLLRCLALLTALALACACSSHQDQGAQSAGIPGEPSSQASADGASADAASADDETVTEDDGPSNPLLYMVSFVVRGSDGVVLAQEEARAAGAEENADAGESGEGQASSGDDAAGTGVEDGERAEGEDTVGGAGTEPVEDADGGYLAGRMKGLSQLVRLRKKLPDGALGLEMRTRTDIKTAVQLMQSEGFYDGRAEFELQDTDTKLAKVTVILHPGTRYVVGDTTIVYDPVPKIPAAMRDRVDELFPRAAIPGIENGTSVNAPTMLAKVTRMPEALQEQGWPDARITEQHYYLDRGRKTLNVAIAIDPGRAAKIGRVIVTGESQVKPDFVAGLAEWEPGDEFWDTRRVDDYVSELRKSGLFRNVTLVVMKDMEKDDGVNVPERPVAVKVEDAKFRTLSAKLRYETDTGIGVEGGWEHRNLFGRAEKLTLTVPISTTATGLKAKFEKPAFLSRHQKLLLGGSALTENSDGYDRQGVALSGGVERKWTREYSTYGGLFGDVGKIKSSDASSWQDYSVYGAEIKLTRDTRNDTLNPSAGSQIDVAFKPMTGQYDGDFSGLGTQVGLRGYYAPFRKVDGSPDDSLILAGRVEAGGFSGADLRNIPPSHRYYLGGAGTVRGYGYQGIGPEDEDGDPMGARSYQLVNLETRFKVTEEMGFVCFLDGGMAYTQEMPKLDLDMDWGAGVGVRYFTPIGPVRFDVAVPIKDDANPPVQFYISIGQAF